MTNQKGSGLGLTTAYSIAKNHDGLITVDSKLGTGSTFYIYLPASSKPAKPKLPSIVKVLSGKRKKGKILFMDDEEILRDVAFNILSKIGYDVTTTIDGFKAIQLYKKAKSSSEPFDAVIMDLTIPGGMGGKEALQKLRRIDPRVKVIVSSGYSNDPIMSNFHDYGCSAVIAKPYKIEELNKILQEVISHK
jgi:CheY-like chemotaxis protein